MKQILLIDDNKSLRQLFREILEEADHEVDIADNGETGLEKFRTKKYDLVVTDVYMPVKGGLQTIQEMKNLNPTVKIIAMSGGTPGMHTSLLDMSKSLGADKTLAKPFTGEAILAAIREVFNND